MYFVWGYVCFLFYFLFCFVFCFVCLFVCFCFVLFVFCLVLLFRLFVLSAIKTNNVWVLYLAMTGLSLPLQL